MYAKQLKKSLHEITLKHEDMFAAYKQSYNIASSESIAFEYLSTKRFSRHKQPNQIREALEKGYLEMSHINLTICRECLHAEYEAEYTVERLVSGG